MVYIFLASIAPAQAEGKQSLVYDLSINGLVVGERKLDITYIPSSKSNPLGMRRIEVKTTLKATIKGEEIDYSQRGTAQISERRSSFVVSTKINNAVTEIQGKRSKKGNWFVHKISATGLEKKEYRRSQVSAISLELFDPGHIDFWQDKEPYKILVLEGLEPVVVSGAWAMQDVVNLSSEVRSLAAKKLQGKSVQGVLNAVWSDDGMLIDWSVDIMGVELNADIRSIPKSPNFGEITFPNAFDGVEEQEL